MADNHTAIPNAELLEAVAVLKPVIFLDTLSRFTTSESENAAAENRAFAAALRELLRAGARAIVVLHHRPKSAADAEEMTLENVLRGTGDFGAMCIAVWGIEHDRGPKTKRTGGAWLRESKDLGRLRVSCVKPGDFEQPSDFHVQLRPFLDEVGSPALLDEKQFEDRGKSFDKQIEKKIRGLIRKNKHTSYREIAAAAGIALGQVKGWMAQLELYKDEEKGWQQGGEV